MRKRMCRVLLMMMAVTFVAMLSSCHKNINTTDFRYRDHRQHRERDKGKDDKDVTPSPSMTQDWATLNVKLGKKDNHKLYKELKSWLGTPYQFASAKKGEGTDCSGMVMMVYKEVYGIPLERGATSMYKKNCVPISRSELDEGDLVFFHGKNGGSITHVGIYLKEGKFVHASSSRGVRVNDLSQEYYDKHYECAGRVKR